MWSSRLYNVPLAMIRLRIGYGSESTGQRYTHALLEIGADEIARLPSIATMASDCKHAA
jgi:hypothetical protein